MPGRQDPFGVVDVELNQHASHFHVQRLGRAGDDALECLVGKRGNAEVHPRAPRDCAYVDVSGIGTVSRSLATCSSLSRAPVVGPTRLPGCTFRSVMTPSNGALTSRYASISDTALTAAPAAPPLLFSAADVRTRGFEAALGDLEVVSRHDSRRGAGGLET